MKTLFATFAAALLACSVFSHQAGAVPITGTIDFAGQATFNTMSLATATQVINFRPFTGGPNNTAAITNATGSFATTITPGVTFASFPNIYIFNPSSPVTPLWTAGGFTFNLTSSTIVTQNSASLMITGVGILTGPAGFDPTPGIWSFTTQSSGGAPSASFSFSADAAAVPDGGSTVALLGVALLGVVGLRRKLARS